ncbi:MAG: hypothetical protein JW967_11530 [Dehalococcoidales bacterium]|nr:hypothetical protein [Dehalococcoidales bacterium]
MQTTKYDKYFIRGPKPGGFRKFDVVYLDDSIIKGSLYFALSMITLDKVPPDHGPHSHDFSEIMGFFGTNPDDPYDLGAEFTLYMGEEMEPHTFDKSTLVYVPATLPHGPLVHKKVYKPYIFVYTFPKASLQETTRKDLMSLVPEEDRKNVFFPYDKKK